MLSLARGGRVIEAYILKLGRRLQCFGEHVFDQWVRLEADPTVHVFCERPVYLDRAAGRVVAFWVMQEGREALLVVDTDVPASSLALDGVELPVRSYARQCLIRKGDVIDKSCRGK